MMEMVIKNIKVRYVPNCGTMEQRLLARRNQRFPSMNTVLQVLEIYKCAQDNVIGFFTSLHSGFACVNLKIQKKGPQKCLKFKILTK